MTLAALGRARTYACRLKPGLMQLTSRADAGVSVRGSGSIGCRVCSPQMTRSRAGLRAGRGAGWGHADRLAGYVTRAP
jgi:hypothetical protein